ncbi:MAG: hypothetical protein H6734_27030 [Alphaproteobacteria bacterium]|nr:hypothetical protein [Alphaproteobacteria bacterium]
MIALLLGTAGAAVVNADLCFRVPNNLNTEPTYADYFTDTTATRVLRGVWVIAASPNHVAYGYADSLGADRGCVHFQLHDNAQYVVQVQSVAYIEGRPVRIEDDAGSPMLSVPADASFTPTAGQHWYTLNGDPYWDQLVLFGWMFAREDWTIPAGSSYTVRVVNKDEDDGDGGPPDGNLDCCYHSGGEIVIGATRSMGVVAHEGGHWIQWALNGKRNNNKNYNADVSNCDTVGPVNNGQQAKGAWFIDREHDSAAAVEGFANFVSAWMWNRRWENDCAVRDARGANYDLSADNLPDNNHNGVLGNMSCESAPNDYNSNGAYDPGDEANWEPNVDAKDWLQDMHDETTTNCQQTMVGYSTVYDWTRFFWDVTTDEGLTPSEIAEIWTEARAYSWDPVVGGSGSSNDPIRRMEDAFDALGHGAAFDNQKNNGLDHY